MQAFWIALGFVFLAEMGDKTQLVSLAFASRYSAKIVLAGVFVATLLVHILSVVLGESAAMVLPRFWIDIAAGLSFIGFGIWTLRGDELKEGEIDKPSRFGPFLTVGTTFFLAELGDKTMLTTITIASQQRQFVAVWLGSTVGMVAADGLAIMVGNLLGAKLPERAIKLSAAAFFIGSGIYVLVQATMLWWR
jgi:putative Ca2+/H+ antiporter (TMEM165/GDT1 family)